MTARDTGRTRADSPPNPSRRLMLAGASAALLAGAAIATAAKGATAGSDTELIRLCDEYHRQHDVAYSCNDTGWEDALDETWAIADEPSEMPATTNEGRRAKAGVAARLLAEEHRSDLDCQFALAVLRDLAGESLA